MPDSTPTRDAGPLHDLLCAYDEWLNGEDSDDTIRWHATEFLRSAVSAEHRAALAASPAPTDSPDEVMGIPFRASALVQRDAVLFETGRPAAEPGTYVNTPAGMRALALDRPAAVTAPREDEVCAWCHHVGTHDPYCRATTQNGHAAAAVERTHRVTTFTSEDGVEMRALTREAPAVERATPDPDTLAALLVDSFVYVDVGTGPYSLIDTTATARALIAAGVTLNETATTPTQEDAK